MKKPTSDPDSDRKKDLQDDLLDALRRKDSNLALDAISKFIKKKPKPN